jgi:HEAT repeat protein
MTQQVLLFAIASCLVFGSPRMLLAAQADDVLSKIEEMARSGDSSDRSLGTVIAAGIDKAASEVSKALLPKLVDSTATEQQLTVYTWALGLARDPKATPAIEKLYEKSTSEMVKANCLTALARIGGKRAGTFLLSVLNAATDDEQRFGVLNLLGQMQCAEALPKTEVILKQDPKELYWQSIFVFGKMGDKAVPFLLKKLKDKDRNTRANALNVLGQWLIPPEAAKPLQELYWTEKDAELRRAILSSLERTIADPVKLKAALEQVVAKEKDERLLKFARETLDSMVQWKAKIAAHEQERKASPEDFKREFDKLFESCGKEGDYKALGASSTVQNESQLKALRERILQRDSDEAFYDYQKVNGIIVLNRTVAAARPSKAAPPAPSADPPARGPGAHEAQK